MLSKDDAYRNAHKMTRKELAKIVGIPETSLRDIENAKYNMTPEVAD